MATNGSISSRGKTIGRTILMNHQIGHESSTISTFHPQTKVSTLSHFKEAEGPTGVKEPAILSTDTVDTFSPLDPGLNQPIYYENDLEASVDIEDTNDNSQPRRHNPIDDEAEEVERS